MTRRPRRSAAVLVGLCLALAGCTGGGGGERIPGVRPGVTLGAGDTRPPAPEARAPVLGAEDDRLGVPDFAGQVLVVNFWASWCGPCRAEQPDLNEARAALPADEVAFLGVNIQDTTVNAKAHVREFEVAYPSLFDPANEYAAAYEGVGPRSIPTTIIIDQHGRVAARLFGLTTTTEVVVLVSRLLEGTTT